MRYIGDVCQFGGIKKHIISAGSVRGIDISDISGGKK
jgi:hypothetical protein